MDGARSSDGDGRIRHSRARLDTHLSRRPGSMARLVPPIVIASLCALSATLTARMQDKRLEHRRYILAHGEDLPEIRDWKWSARA